MRAVRKPPARPFRYREWKWNQSMRAVKDHLPLPFIGGMRKRCSLNALGMSRMVLTS